MRIRRGAGVLGRSADHPNTRDERKRDRRDHLFVELVQNVIAFLTGVGNTAVIRAMLAQRGYSAAEHTTGWTLLHLVSGFNAPFPADSTEAAVRDAVTTIDAWDEPTFRTTKAALIRKHPDQAKFVFDKLEPGSGLEAVLATETFLDRLDALEASPDRAATRDADHAALATMAERGISPEVRAEMRTLIGTAKTGSLPLEPIEDPAAKDVVALHAWYNDWSETARTYIKRRDYLIRLGLSKRKRSKKSQPVEPVAPPAPQPQPPPVVVAPPAPPAPPPPQNGSPTEPFAPVA